jgi:hypothetical protein
MFCSCSRRDGLSSLCTSNPLIEFANTAMSHLSASHVDYLIHWTGLLLIEESQTSDPICQKDLWCLNPQQRCVVFMNSLSQTHQKLKICASFITILFLYSAKTSFNRSCLF